MNIEDFETEADLVAAFRKLKTSSMIHSYGSFSIDEKDERFSQLYDLAYEVLNDSMAGVETRSLESIYTRVMELCLAKNYKATGHFWQEVNKLVQ